MSCQVTFLYQGSRGTERYGDLSEVPQQGRGAAKTRPLRPKNPKSRFSAPALCQPGDMKTLGALSHETTKSTVIAIIQTFLRFGQGLF